MARFLTTRWSLVLQAAAGGSGEARMALSELCGIYWAPLYAFARRGGASREDAEDEVQGFLALMLERGGFTGVRADRGRFRSYLLAAFKHYRADERRRQRAVKRGGGAPVLSLDLHAAERRLALEPADERLSPERIFERAWARAVLDRALSALERQYRDRPDLFEALRPYLVGDADAVPYAELAARQGLTEGAVKVAVHRLRRRYRDLLRAEVAQTLDDPDEAEEELRHLVAALRS